MSCGQVTINDAPTKSKLVRFCEKKIDQWIQTHSEELREIQKSEIPAEIEFKVSFTEESDSHHVSCTTELLLGSMVFRGWDLAADTQMAFMHSLKRLQPH